MQDKNDLSATIPEKPTDPNNQAISPATETPIVEQDSENSVYDEEIASPEEASLEQALPLKINEKGSSKKLVYLFISVFLLSIVGAGLALYLLVFNTTEQEEELANLNRPSRKNQILQDIARNNPTGLIDLSDPVDFSNTDSNFEEDFSINSPGNSLPKGLTNPLENPNIPAPRMNPSTSIGDFDAPFLIPDLDVYNYRFTTSTITPGPAAESCNYYVPIEEETYKFTEYFDLDRTYYKSESFDSQDQIFDYQLGKYGNSENEYLYYIGGSMAALNLFDVSPNFSNDYLFTPSSYPDSGPVSSPSSYPGQDIISLFGGEAEITDLEEVDGVIYYNVTISSPYSCNPYAPYTYDHVLITIYRVNSETYEITGIRTFLDVVHESTLISETTTSSTRDTVTLGEVEPEFTFDYNASTIEIDYRDYVYDPDVEFNKLRDHLITDTEQALVYPDTSRFDPLYLYGKDLPERVDNERYYLNPDFYPDTTRGQERYEELIEYRSRQPILSISSYESDTNFSWLQAEIFSDDRTIQDIYNDKTSYLNGTYVIKDVPIYFDDGPVNATQLLIDYYVTYPYPISYPDSYASSYPSSGPGSYPGGYTYKYQNSYLALTDIVTGEIYVLNNYNYSDDYMREIVYSLSSANDADYESYLELLRGTFEYNHFCGL